MKYEHNHYEIAEFISLDNHLIDSVFSSLLTMSEDQQNRGMLAEKELIYHLRKIAKDLDFLLDLPFEKFWAYMTKLNVFIDNMDSFL